MIAGGEIKLLVLVRKFMLNREQRGTLSFVSILRTISPHELTQLTAGGLASPPPIMNEPEEFEEGLAIPHKLPTASLYSGSPDMLLGA